MEVAGPARSLCQRGEKRKEREKGKEGRQGENKEECEMGKEGGGEEMAEKGQKVEKGEEKVEGRGEREKKRRNPK